MQCLGGNGYINGTWNALMGSIAELGIKITPLADTSAMQDCMQLALERKKLEECSSDESSTKRFLGKAMSRSPVPSVVAQCIIHLRLLLHFPSSPTSLCCKIRLKRHLENLIESLGDLVVHFSKQLSLPIDMWI